MKPYDKPEFVEVKPNQTAFVIPLVGSTSDQGKFESEKFLKDAQVATKRIQIPHEWIKTGRGAGTGEYKDTVRVIVVDRYPETRQWAKDKAFVGESKDSIKFNQGISATTQIIEEDTAKYLYQNAGKSLQTVMDNEIHDYIGSVLLEEYSTRNIDDIRGNKGAILNKVREKVVPYFKVKGITISNLGYVDDLKYLQDDIQTAINKKFTALQDQKAQSVINQTNIDTAKAEAKANNLRKQSMKEIAEMKKLELQEKWINKWDGSLPTYQAGQDSSTIVSIPKP